jgi:hypothetical protein
LLNELNERKLEDMYLYIQVYQRFRFVSSR